VSVPILSAAPDAPGDVEATRSLRGLRIGVPFVAVHLSCIAVFFVGWSPVALGLCVFTYVTRGFGITVFYHRYLSHRSFKMSRFWRFCGALLGTSASQRGPLWWVAHHRRHHRYTDKAGDPHSPVTGSMWHAHVLWLFQAANQPTAIAEVPDLAKFPEMRLLDRYHHIVSAVIAASCFGLGVLLGHYFPGLHTSGWQLIVWGFCLSTVALYHSTFSVNSVAHRWGARRFDTKDASRNNRVVSFLTLGEGWHNNHHKYPNTARQGIGRSELDPGWWLIRTMAALHIATEVRQVPAAALAEARRTS
jgi:stearoyl-CoA desaturase (delta-9 desaturase)